MSKWKICLRYDGVSVKRVQNPQHCVLCTQANARTGTDLIILDHGVLYVELLEPGIDSMNFASLDDVRVQVVGELEPNITQKIVQIAVAPPEM